MSDETVTALDDRRPLDTSADLDAADIGPVPEGVKGLDMPLGRRVRLDGRGTTFVREIAGPSPDAPTVVLLHGWFASGGLNWFNCFEPMSEHFNVIAPDLRGHGRGIKNRRRFRLSACADDVAALCAELGVEKAIFCGYSMGGPVAQLMWRRHPQLVSGLVFCATSSSFIPALQQRLIFAGSMALMASTTRTTQMITRLPKPVRQALPKGLRGTSRPSSLQVWAAQEMRRHDMRMVLEAGTAIGTFSSRRWIGTVDVPTTVLITTKDKAVSPSAQLSLALAIPGATIQRYDEGHTSPVLESFGQAITGANVSVADAIGRTRRRSDRSAPTTRTRPAKAAPQSSAPKSSAPKSSAPKSSAPKSSAPKRTAPPKGIS